MKRTQSRAPGFTLVELLIAMSISLFMMGIATSAFYHTRKAVLTAERVAAKNNVTQSMMLWVMSGQPAANFPIDDQGRGVSGIILEVSNPTYGGSIYHLCVVDPTKKGKSTTMTGGRFYCPLWASDHSGESIPQGIGITWCANCSEHYLWTKRSGDSIESAIIELSPIYVPKH